MHRRQPQDPQGSTARAFRKYLEDNPQHRDRSLHQRLTNPYQSSMDLGMAAAGLLVFAIVLMGIFRLLTGTLYI